MSADIKFDALKCPKCSQRLEAYEMDIFEEDGETFQRIFWGCRGLRDRSCLFPLYIPRNVFWTKRTEEQMRRRFIPLPNLQLLPPNYYYLYPRLFRDLGDASHLKALRGEDGKKFEKIVDSIVARNEIQREQSSEPLNIDEQPSCSSKDLAADKSGVIDVEGDHSFHIPKQFSSLAAGASGSDDVRLNLGSQKRKGRNKSRSAVEILRGISHKVPSVAVEEKNAGGAALTSPEAEVCNVGDEVVGGSRRTLRRRDKKKRIPDESDREEQGDSTARAKRVAVEGENAHKAEEDEEEEPSKLETAIVIGRLLKSQRRPGLESSLVPFSPLLMGKEKLVSYKYSGLVDAKCAAIAAKKMGMASASASSNVDAVDGAGSSATSVQGASSAAQTAAAVPEQNLNAKEELPKTDGSVSSVPDSSTSAAGINGATCSLPHSKKKGFAELLQLLKPSPEKKKPGLLRCKITKGSPSPFSKGLLPADAIEPRDWRRPVKLVKGSALDALAAVYNLRFNRETFLDTMGAELRVQGVLKREPTIPIRQERIVRRLFEDDVQKPMDIDALRRDINPNTLRFQMAHRLGLNDLNSLSELQSEANVAGSAQHGDGLTEMNVSSGSTAEGNTLNSTPPQATDGTEVRLAGNNRSKSQPLLQSLYAASISRAPNSATDLGSVLRSSITSLQDVSGCESERSSVVEKKTPSAEVSFGDDHGDHIKAATQPQQSPSTSAAAVGRQSFVYENNRVFALLAPPAPSSSSSKILPEESDSRRSSSSRGEVDIESVFEEYCE